MTLKNVTLKFFQPSSVVSPTDHPINVHTGPERRYRLKEKHKDAAPGYSGAGACASPTRSPEGVPQPGSPNPRVREMKRVGT